MARKVKAEEVEIGKTRKPSDYKVDNFTLDGTSDEEDISLTVECKVGSP